MLVEKGLYLVLLVGPFLMIPLIFSDRHHRQLRKTLQVLTLLPRSLRPFPHELQELHGVRRVWIRLGAGELLSRQPTSVTVPVTTVKLVGDLAGRIVAIHRQLPGAEALLSPVESGAKLGETASHPGQPLVRRTGGGSPGGEQAHGHGLTQGPQVQGIGVEADHALHRSGGLAVLALPDLGLAFLGVAVEDDGGSAYQVIFEELVQLLGVKTGKV